MGEEGDSSQDSGSEGEECARDWVPPIQIGDEIPNFTADTHLGMITLHDFIGGSWAVILTFPRGGDPVLSTELGMLSKLVEEFEARTCKVIAVGVGSKSSHRNFIKDTQELQGCDIRFPVVIDHDGAVLHSMGLTRPDTKDPIRGLVLQNSLFLVDLDRRVRIVSQYPCSVGQNYYEILRALDALQLVTYHEVGTPANWKEGEDVFILPSVSSANAPQMFPKGFAEIRKWFRITPQPATENM